MRRVGRQLALDKTWEMPENVIFRDGGMETAPGTGDMTSDIWPLIGRK